MPLIVLGVIAFLALIFLPQLWVKKVLRDNQTDNPAIEGTGAELARHLLSKAELGDIEVEETELGDHYDPEARVVRLTAPHFSGRSVAALAVAAHEVGHALQHAHQDRVFGLRQAMAPRLVWIERGAQVVFFLIPVIGALTRSPVLAAAQLGLVVLLLGSRLAFHLVTLPVEIDASFNRALPILESGAFLPAETLPAARKVLRAASLTYLAAALISLVDIARLIRVLR